MLFVIAEDAYILAKEKGYTKQKEFDRSSLVGSFSSAREKARYKYPLYYHDKTSTDVAPISKKPGVEAYKKRSADRAELRKNWTLLYERAGKQVAMLTSGPKGHQRASFQEVLSILSDASLLPILELPPGGKAKITHSMIVLFARKLLSTFFFFLRYCI